MPFQVQCGCGAKLNVADDRRGSTGRCPKCGISVPLVPAPPKVRKWTCPGCQGEFSIPVSETRERCEDCESAPVRMTSKLASRKVLAGIAAGILSLILVATAYPLVLGGKPSLNPLQSIFNGHLQSAVNRVNPANSKISSVNATAYFSSPFGQSTLVYNLRGISGEPDPVSVFRLLAGFAGEVQDGEFEQVVLAFRGTPKFLIDGEDFRELGRRYPLDHPVVMMRDFPPTLTTPTGERPYRSRSSGLSGRGSPGLIGPLGSSNPLAINDVPGLSNPFEMPAPPDPLRGPHGFPPLPPSVPEEPLEGMEDFQDVHEEWYLNDLRGAN